MDISEKPKFIQMLKSILASYGKALPEAAILSAWWTDLEVYPLGIVAIAFSSYRDENGEFAPVPAGIAKRCRLMDGRPSADEAWAIALTSRDESETVVWTREIAEAFSICSTVFPDEVGARMAFKDAYGRLVTAARAAGTPAQWSVSLGWDTRKREASLTKASSSGFLPAPMVAALLPAPVTDVIEDPGARAQIDKIKQMLATMSAERQREMDLHAQREREATAEAKRHASELAANYRPSEAA